MDGEKPLLMYHWRLRRKNNKIGKSNTGMLKIKDDICASCQLPDFLWLNLV